MSEEQSRAGRGGTASEWAVLGGFVLLGLTIPLLFEVYDSGRASVGILLTFLSLLVSLAASRIGLRLSGVKHDRLTPAAVWAVLGWSVLPLSQLPYLGYLMIPIEVLLGALFASFRGGISLPKAVLPVSIARFLALAAAYSVRSLL